MSHWRCIHCQHSEYVEEANNDLIHCANCKSIHSRWNLDLPYLVEWQPIETAPKDGTRIDVWAEWPEHERSFRTPDAYWNGRCWQLGQHNEEQFAHRPRITHWMPLPAAPEASKDMLAEGGR